MTRDDLPIGSLERAVIREFYRSLSTDQLLQYRAALGAESTTARRRPRRARFSDAFCNVRRQLIAEVLRERGVEALT